MINISTPPNISIRKWRLTGNLSSKRRIEVNNRLLDNLLIWSENAWRCNGISRWLLKIKKINEILLN